MKGKKKKRKPCLFPPPLPFFVITKEQTHIKHTQGAAAVIAVSAVLLWVAGDDNTSHRNIYIIFLIMSGLNHGQLEAGHILQNICAYDKHIFLGGGGTLLLFVSRRLSAPPSICIYWMLAKCLLDDISKPAPTPKVFFFFSLLFTKSTLLYPSPGPLYSEQAGDLIAPKLLKEGGGSSQSELVCITIPHTVLMLC